MQEDPLRPIRQESLRDIVVSRIETLILSGRISIGEKLPPERDIAQQLNVSRPVVHEGLLDLVGKGLVSMKPRLGTVVNDYRRQGSLALLTTLFKYHQGSIDTALLDGLIEMRMLFELETTRLAALNRTQEHLCELSTIISDEQETDLKDIDRICELDFAFHHLIAIASGNPIYPMLLNSFKQVYTNLSSQAFSDHRVVPVAFGYHRDLVAALDEKDQAKAAAVMQSILTHGKHNLDQAIKK